jgi:hypothetical protein
MMRQQGCLGAEQGTAGRGQGTGRGRPAAAPLDRGHLCAGLSKIPYDFGKATASPTGSKT